jgi:diphthamide biosynthesis methyltransferase
MRTRKPKGMYKTTCSKCKGLLDANRQGKQRYCKSCHAKYMRITRPKHSLLESEARKKANARSYAHVYVKRGIIEKKGCIICGDLAEAHHEDYDKPLEIIWLCRKHHLEHHKINKDGNIKSNQ